MAFLKDRYDQADLFSFRSHDHLLVNSLQRPSIGYFDSIDSMDKDWGCLYASSVESGLGLEPSQEAKFLLFQPVSWQFHSMEEALCLLNRSF